MYATMQWLLTRATTGNSVQRRDKVRRELSEGSLLQNRTPPIWCLPHIEPVHRGATRAVLPACKMGIVVYSVVEG